jgi:3-isopropylmalate dehydrogenase
MAQKNEFKLAVLAGDGIGPEITEATLKVLGWLSKEYGFKLETEALPFGGASIDAHGTSLTEQTLHRCRQADSVLLAAVGGPKWDRCPQDVRPEAGLLRIRNELGLYCNLRPASVYPQLADASPLKENVIRGTDLLVVRELTGGIYFGTPRGTDGEQAWNTARYARHEVERIARRAFELARVRRKKVTNVDKANVLEVSRFWREIVVSVAKDYPDVELNHLYVDNAAMQLVRVPSSFDVLVTSNLFGDILSDLAGMLTGSLGMLPSASLGDKHSLYEPIHGSAPDIAGQNKANPLGMIGSAAMMFEYSLGRPDVADCIRRAISLAFDGGARTGDIAAKGQTVLSTTEMTTRLLETLGTAKTQLQKQAAGVQNVPPAVSRS